jgi:hypothetical protein
MDERMSEDCVIENGRISTKMSKPSIHSKRAWYIKVSNTKSEMCKEISTVKKPGSKDVSRKNRDRSKKRK